MIGTVRGLRFENGTQLRMDDIINEQLQDDTHIWVILKGIKFLKFIFSESFYRGYRSHE